MMSELNPGIILVVGALAVPFLPTLLRSAWMLALPVLALIQMLGLPIGEFGQIQLFDLTLVTLRVDKLALVFGGIFIIATLLGVIYALHVRDALQQTSGLIYAGAAVGAVFAGDLVTLFVFWELTAIASVFLIWAAGTRSAQNAGMRYLIVQIGSGVILLAGVLMYFRETGSIAFNAIGIETLAGQLILIAFGIKCAFPLLHNWLQDSYPEATITGTVFLSAFTTKLAVYGLARGFAGTELLITIGAIMAAFPVFYAVIENDLRRVLAYSLNSQLGFMVVGVGIGTSMSLDGTAAHAVCSVLYKALLFMAVGAVMLRTGTAKATELGGLYHSMPRTAILCLIGAASVSAVPLFSGFVSKSLVIGAAMKEGHFWVWLALLFASVGAFHNAGFKVPYFTFFGRDSGKRPAEAPGNMLIAMGLTAIACVALGVLPGTFYSVLPNGTTYDPYTFEHIITQLQLLALAGLGLAMLFQFQIYPREMRATNVDTDWFYRRIGYNLGSTLLILASDTWKFVAAAVREGFGALERSLDYHHNPDSILGRTWPTGIMAFWATLMLGGYLLTFYFR